MGSPPRSPEGEGEVVAPVEAEEMDEGGAARGAAEQEQGAGDDGPRGVGDVPWARGLARAAFVRNNRAQRTRTADTRGARRWRQRDEEVPWYPIRLILTLVIRPPLIGG